MIVNLFSYKYNTNISGNMGPTIDVEKSNISDNCLVSVELKHGNGEGLFVYGNIGNMELSEDSENVDSFVQKNWEVLKNAVENRQKED